MIYWHITPFAAANQERQRGSPQMARSSRHPMRRHVRSWHNASFRCASNVWTLLEGGLNGSTQHSILKGKDGVFGNASRLFSRLYGIREDRALGSLAAGGVAERDWASVW